MYDIIQLEREHALFTKEPDIWVKETIEKYLYGIDLYLQTSKELIKTIVCKSLKITEQEKEGIENLLKREVPYRMQLYFSFVKEIRSCINNYIGESTIVPSYYLSHALIKRIKKHEQKREKDFTALFKPLLRMIDKIILPPKNTLNQLKKAV